MSLKQVAKCVTEGCSFTEDNPTILEQHLVENPTHDLRMAIILTEEN